MKSLPTVVAASILLGLFGCKQGDAPQNKIYDIQGKVVALDAVKKKVTLDHEEIPGLMKAMQMPFSVENAKVLDGIKAGDQVHGKLKVQGNDYVITELMKRSTPDDTEAEIKAALAKLSEADRELAAAQRTCPVHKDSPLGSMGVPIKLMIQDQPVFLCCKGCEKAAKANPKKTLAEVARLKAAAK